MNIPRDKNLVLSTYTISSQHVRPRTAQQNSVTTCGCAHQIVARSSRRTGECEPTEGSVGKTLLGKF